MRRGVNPTLIIRAPDGRHMAVALDSTDYIVADQVAQPMGPPHLLDIEGLWDAVQLIEQIRQQSPAPTSGSEAAGDVSYD